MRIRDLLMGWGRQPLADGLVLTPPVDGIGKVKITERAGLRRMKDVVAHVVARVPPESLSSVHVGPLSRFATHEGEHAGLLTISVVGGEPWERTLGMVAGDDGHVLIAGTATATEYLAQLREIVELMTRSWFLCLGENRRRRYGYDRPAGWHGTPYHYATRHYHPDYPRVVSAITVHEARPTQATDAEALDRMLFVETWSGAERDPPTPPTPLLSRSKMTGQLTRITGVQGGFRMATLQAVYTDSRYTYIIQLDTRMDSLKDSLPAFSDVVTSVEPVPGIAAKRQSSLIQWVD